VRIASYPVQEMGGLVWAYIGPEPAPLLPRYDLFVREDVDREIGFAVIPCNWFQIMENSLDPVHAEHLHGNHANYMLERQGKPAMHVRRHVRTAFDVFPYGVSKRRLLEGQTEEVDDWRIGILCCSRTSWRSAPPPRRSSNCVCPSTTPPPCTGGTSPADDSLAKRPSRPSRSTSSCTATRTAASWSRPLWARTS